MNSANETILAINRAAELADAAYTVIGFIFIGIIILAIYKAYVKWI